EPEYVPVSDDLLPEQPAKSSPTDNNITIPRDFLFRRPALKIFPRLKNKTPYHSSQPLDTQSLASGKTW
ncbi:hypothetical protein RJ921_34025, partial [Pseudomonas aeruginosa]|uniref:hypothetical protein n=1 Tax=Pseudomonas aeruginosa TaxID=287 RepID=UPI0030143FE3